MINRGVVSIIIPVFNRPHQIKDAVMSALLQSYSNIEIIIVNDGSTDKTSSVIEELALIWPDSVKVYNQENAGPGKARQKGTENSTGEFIQFLDSDDIIFSRKIERQVDALNNWPGSDICYGISLQQDYSYDPPLLIGVMRETGKEMPRLFPRLLNERWWTTSCPLYRKTLIDRIGPWKKYLNEEDWEFDARAGREGINLVWISDIVSIRRINQNNDHLSRGGYTDPRKVRDRIHAKYDIYECALVANVSHQSREMYQFSRECFLLARQSAEIGLYKEAESIFKLTYRCSVAQGNYRLDVLVYALMGHLLGWARIGAMTKRIKTMLN